MPFRVGAASVALGSIIAGCSSGSNIQPTPGPTVNLIASATPSAAPTPTPSSGASEPPMVGTGCAAPLEPVPGTYVSIVTTGTVSGSTYTEDGTNDSYYTLTQYTTATPPASSGPPTASPTPTSGPSEAPTPTATPGAPSPTPSGSPTATPVATFSTQYVGTYALPAFGSAQATTGCLELVLTQPQGGTAGQTRRRDDAASNAAMGYGDPPLSFYGGTDIDAGSGQIVSFTIRNLTQTTGNGTFTLDNGVTGTVTITGSQSYTNGLRARSLRARR